MPHLVIAGWSTRAIAESAARSGFTVTAVDVFADLDQHPGVRAIAVPQASSVRLTARAIARAAQAVPSDAVAYLSPFENNPGAVARLARGRILWGNPPETLRRARDPIGVMQALARVGFTVPNTYGPNPPSRAAIEQARYGAAGLPSRAAIEQARYGAAGLPSRAAIEQARYGAASEYLVKPLASGGGRGVRLWRPGSPVPAGCYLQQRIEGVPGSVVFVSAGKRAVPLGVSRQIVGDAAFGAHGFRYCGSILAAPGDGAFGDDAALLSGAESLAGAAAAELDLVGVNGVDFIAQGGVPIAIEVNPRWPSSIELVERAGGHPLFAAHVEACASGALPVRALAGRFVFGKAIVFARADGPVGDTRRWAADPDVRDIPSPGEHIRAGHPVCTVFAQAGTASGCYAALVERAAAVYALLKP